VLLKRIASYRDPKLYAMSLVAEQLSKSSQPLVPERVFVAGSPSGNGNGHSSTDTAGLFGMLINLLVAEKAGFSLDKPEPILADAEQFAEHMTRKVLMSAEENSEVAHQ
jgi:hypothetical protein